MLGPKRLSKNIIQRSTIAKAIGQVLEMKRSTAILIGMVAAAFAYFSYEILFIFPTLGSYTVITFNYMLIFAEMLCALFSIYLYHSIFCTVEWKHASYEGLKKHPFVSLHIPVFNEPFGMVKKTLTAAMNQDYPKKKYEIIIADDSTDTRAAKRLREFCRANKIKYFHRNNRRGFKAGALNDIEPYSRGEVMALLDADDKPEPTFLSHAVETLFSSNKVAFVQTRNAERNEWFNSVTEIGRMIRDLFFGAIQKSKDMRKLCIFCGSGGVIKRNLLKKYGGWPEETVTEDIDLSTKLYGGGYVSKYINPVECRGLLSPTFTGLSGQTFRWAHGTTRTLKLRWKNILKIPGFFRKLEHFLSCMTYLLGPAIVTIDILMVAHLIFHIPIFHMYEPSMLWIFGLGLTMSAFLCLLFVQFIDKRIHMKRIFMYIFAMYGMSVNFTIATFSALLGRKFAFFRTPRSNKNKNLKRIAKRYWIETLIGSVSIYAGLISLSDPSYVMQAFWVMFFGIGFLSAPVLAFRYG